MVTKAWLATQSLEWSSMMLSTSKTTPSATSTWVTSACQVSLGTSAQKRLRELFGLFWGWGITKPLALSTRQIVEVDATTSAWRFWRWYLIVSAPASTPRSKSSFRKLTISSS